MHGTDDSVVPFNQIKIFSLGFFGSSKIAERFEKFGYIYNIYRHKGHNHEIAGAMYETVPEQLFFLENNVIGKSGYCIDATVDNPDIALDFETGDVIASGEQMKWVIEGRYDGAAMFASEYDELKATVDPNDELYFVPFYAVKTWTLYPKSETQLVADIDSAMKQLLDDGTLSEVSIEWFGYDVYELFDE